MRSVNPYTEEVMKEFGEISIEQALEQLKKSKQAQERWKLLSVADRIPYLTKLAAVLRKNKQRYAEMITKEMGKPIKESLGEVEKCAWLADYFAEKSEEFLKDEHIKTDFKKSYIRFQPLGAVFTIMPWNYPFWQVYRQAVLSTVAGNACLLKHASNVPQTALFIEESFKEAGYPDHIFKTLLISSKTAMELIPHVDAVSLTGSNKAGEAVGELAGKHIKPLVLELGGSDPFIVLDDADVKAAAQMAIKTRFINTGQSCIAAKRLIVMEKVAEEFEKEFIAAAKQLKVGDPMDPEIDIGPVAKKGFVDDLESQLRDAEDKGAKVTRIAEKQEKGFFFIPCIVTSTADNMKVLKEETFGPIAPIIIVKSEEEVVKIANDTEFGLGAAIWSKNLERAERLAGQIESGTVVINSMVKSDPRLPFGGIKKSGVGRELSRYGLMEFVNIKTIVVKE
ncbi:NAD-dependent succinate-semialdehyde dehydrogenase [Candidatus Woesearchaeota archaeon]|nr:NAD-dependent succinate-semialdehyde dehydrogenase [Candidatus Woesearchaeota archaeon]